MKDDWIVLKGPVLDDLKVYLLAHEEESALEALFVTVVGRMPAGRCNHERTYVEIEDALANHKGHEKARGHCACGAEITVERGQDGWKRGTG